MWWLGMGTTHRTNTTWRTSWLSTVWPSTMRWEFKDTDAHQYYTALYNVFAFLPLKGHCVVLEKKVRIKVITQTLFRNRINKLFAEGIKVPRTLFEAKEVAGSATYKQRKTRVLSFKVIFSIQFIQTWKQREFVYLVRLGIKTISQWQSFSSTLCTFKWINPSSQSLVMYSWCLIFL